VKAHRFLALYVVLLHIALAGAGFVLLWPNHQPWLLVLELGLLASLVGGFLLLRALDTPREMVEIAGQWIREGELSHRFRLQGPSDLRRLIELYNQMMARLREERTHQEEQDIFLHKVLTASPSGILTTDHEGRIDTVNPAAATLLDLRMEELEGHRPAEHDARMVRLVAEVPRGESRLLGQHGRRRLRCSHSSFFDRGFERSFFVVDDLTHELWATEKTAYDTLIRTLSHEVNNTLGATTTRSSTRSVPSATSCARRIDPTSARLSRWRSNARNTSTTSCGATPRWCACPTRRSVPPTCTSSFPESSALWSRRPGAVR